MSGAVHTVLGPVDPQEVGTSLMHEHLVIDYGEPLGESKNVPEAGSPVETRIVESIGAFAAQGGNLLVDCTPPGYGRYPDLLAKASLETGVHVVACTGGFTEQWAPLHPVVRALDKEALADLFVRECTEGMGGTRHRAGAIKVATGEGRMTDGEEKVFRAAALAHRATGAPIITHTTNGLGPYQAEFLIDEGVDPSKIVVGHLGFEPDPRADVRAILDRGANVAFDRIGHRHFFPDSHWVGLIRYALDLGYAERIALSHDAVTEFNGPAEMAAHTFGDYAYLARDFLPALEEAGVDEVTVDVMIRENPRRILAYPEKAAR
jgi:predicted metal-dependent phosphotriesterase family hydrolase